MAIWLRQSTASQEIPLGYFVSSSDGNTESTSLSIANTDIKLWKNGATSLANKNSGGATHMSNGIYYAVLDATDTNTLGPLVVFCHVSGALAVRVECMVLAANVYDSLVAASDRLDVDTYQITAGAITATAIATDAITADKIAANAITSSELADGAITAAKLASGAITSAKFAAGAIDAAAIAADAIGASELAADAASEIATSVWAATTRVLTANTNLNDPTAAAIADAVWDELLADHNTEDSVGNVLNNLVTEDAGGVYQFNANALENAPSGSGASAETIADAVWDEALSGHTTSGSAGAALSTAATRPAAQDIADVVWGTPISGFATAEDTFGQVVHQLVYEEEGQYVFSANALQFAPAAPTAAEVAEAVWDEALSGHSEEGSAGEALSTAAAGGGGSTAAEVWGYATRSLTDKEGFGLSSSERTSIADAVLGRNLASVTGAAARSLLNAVRYLRNRVSISGTTLTVYQEDDSTAAWTATVSTDEDAAPVTEVDPA